jgi:hypothetical protein
MNPPLRHLEIPHSSFHQQLVIFRQDTEETIAIPANFEK